MHNCLHGGTGSTSALLWSGMMLSCWKEKRVLVIWEVISPRGDPEGSQDMASLWVKDHLLYLADLHGQSQRRGFGFICFLKILYFLCLKQAGMGAGKPIKGRPLLLRDKLGL